jgi:hypothetical protein
MPDPHQQFENRLHAHAKRIIPPGSFVLPIDIAMILGAGDGEVGESIFGKMFSGGRYNPQTARILPPEVVKDVGHGNINAGRRVLDKFVKRLRGRPIGYQSGGAVEPDDEQIIEAGPRPKAGKQIAPIDARPMTGQAAMTALGIPDISSMTPDEQMMFAAGSLPMLAAGPEAKIAEEAIPEAAQAVRQGIRAFHGSPHDFNTFDLSKIGTGQGAQTYGRGLYFAENPAVAESYKLGELADAKVGDAEYDFNNPVHRAAAFIYDHGDRNEAAYQAMRSRAYQDPTDDTMRRTVDVLYSNKDIPLYSTSKSKMYEVNIAADPEHFLDYDRDLKDQHPAVRSAIEKLQAKHLARDPDSSFGTAEPIETGATMYERLAYELGRDHAAATEALREAGIPGIKYRDQGSRGADKADWYRSRITEIQSALGRGAKIKNPFPGELENQHQLRNMLVDYQSKLKSAENPTSNYVVFDDKLIDIIKKYGLAGLIAAGANHYQESEPEQHQARGGAVGRALRYAEGGPVGKMSKADAGYENCADSGRICAICSMWRDNHTCSLVGGTISRTGTCRHFEKSA